MPSGNISGPIHVGVGEGSSVEVEVDTTLGVFGNGVVDIRSVSVGSC
jgi:hypothetical protein